MADVKKDGKKKEVSAIARVLDAVISIINPKAGFKREQFRFAQQQLRAYDAAAMGRRTDGWYATGASQNTENLAALQRLRDRSRELDRNNPYAKKAHQSIANNTVGKGIVPKPTDGNKSDLKRAKELWSYWGEKTTCDFDGQMNFYGLQQLAMRTVAMGGEALLLRRRTKDKRVPIKLQLVEADYIDVYRNISEIENGMGFISQGVEFDGNGNRVAYWLFDRHPGDTFQFKSGLASHRVPADDVIHIYEKMRPGQVHGVPFGCSAMLRLRDFDDYEDAQLVRQKIAACFTAFVNDISDPVSVPSGTTANLSEKVEPGVIQRLAPGQSVTFGNPPPAEGYKDYSMKILQGIAAGYGTTYEMLTGDLSGVNFSSGRMGWIEFHRNVVAWQYFMLIPLMCERAYQWMVDAAMISGELLGQVNSEWTPPRREMIDPVKETNAIGDQMRNGLISGQEALRQQGYDPEEVLDEIAAFNQMLDDKKIKLESDYRNQIGKPLSKKDDPAEV